MSDLISREKIHDYIKGQINPYGKPFEGTAYELGLKIMRYIDAMDSAYDIDKVVEELKQQAEQYRHIAFEVEKKGLSALADKYYGKQCSYEHAIEIVKQGGVGTETETIRYKAVKWNNNSSKRVPYEFIDYIEGKREIGASDDVCEWNLDGVYIFSPHSKMFSSVIDDKHRYTYCPVCGKKIKVVE